MSLADPGERAASLSFLSGGGATGALIRDHDWASTPLGPPEAWPQSLRSALSICLHSSFPTAIYWGPELRLLYNDAWSPIPAERHPWALGRPGAEVWPEIWDVVGPQFGQVIATGEGFSAFDQRLDMIRDGRPRETYWNYSFTPIRGEDGAVVGILNQGNEVTDRILAERRGRFLLGLSDHLRSLADPRAITAAAEEALARFLGANRVGYGEVDETERWFTTESNWTDGCMPPHHGTHDLAGFGPDIHDGLRAGVPLVVANVAEDPRTCAPAALAAFDAIETRAAMTASLVKDGRMRAALYVHARQPRDWTAEDVRLVAEVAERTWSAVERARAEERLRALNESLERQIAERTAERDRMWRLSTDIMLVARMDATIVAVNPAWTRTLGWSESELVGQDFMAFIHPHDGEATLAEVGRLAEGVTTFRFENRYRAKNGEYHWFSWIAVPDEDLIHAVGRDVTNEKHAAEELEQAQEALRQSQKLEAMGQLTGGVAHDFNNLLSPIVGGLDMLQRRGFGDDRAKRTVAGALASAERAKLLVQRLLAFARRQPLQPTAVDLSQLVDGMSGLIASTLGPRVHLRLDAEPRLPAARADVNQIEMALLNLAVNARDAMPDGGDLTVSVRRVAVPECERAELPPGVYLRLAVTDTGVGMEPEVAQRAVEPFFSTKGIGKGTGLGLSMVHGLAAQLGGGLWIDSAPGRGTTIELWLPAVEDAPPVAAAAEGGEPVASRAGRALVVDDEELVRDSTAEMLADLGYDVVECGSAAEALGQLGRGERFDLLVTDHLMSGMTGSELAAVTRRRWPEMRVLIVSGYADADGIAPDLPRLTKPFRLTDLVEALPPS